MTDATGADTTPPAPAHAQEPPQPRPGESARQQLARRLRDFLAAERSTAGWREGTFHPDTPLLGGLLRFTDPGFTTGASVATALDLWVAEQLRAAGLEGVSPRRAAPPYVSRVAGSVLDTGALTDIGAALQTLSEAQDALEQLRDAGKISDRQSLKQLDVQIRKLKTARRSVAGSLSKLRSELERRADTALGEGRRKQVDVFLADWDRGLEIAISTKTLALNVRPEELLKNLPNRWEEFDGDLKNLRGRFPLAAIGALILVPRAAATTGALEAITDMMRKLTAPGREWENAYDAASVIVADPWQKDQPEPVRILVPADLPSSFPADLLPDRFFQVLLQKVLDRSPITEHVRARKARAESQGQDSLPYQAAADALRLSELST